MLAKTKMQVEYADGREVIVKITPRAEVMAEEKFNGLRNNPSVTTRASYFIAWASLHKSGMESDAYEIWLDKIVDVRELIPKGIPCPLCGADDQCGEDEDGNPWIHGSGLDRGDVAEDGSADPTKKGQPAVGS